MLHDVAQQISTTLYNSPQCIFQKVNIVSLRKKKIVLLFG